MAKKKTSKRKGRRSPKSVSFFQSIRNFFVKIFSAPSQRKAEKSRADLIKQIEAKGYSPSYQARLLRAVKSGKATTLQQARGHAPGEARKRAEREREAQGLSSGEIRLIRAFHARYDPRDDKGGPSADEMIEWAQSNGYAKFAAYRKGWSDRRRSYTRAIDLGDYDADDLADLDLEADFFEVPDVTWLYYH